MKGKVFHTLGSPLTGKEISKDREGALEPLRRAQQPVYRGQSAERPAHMVSATHPALLNLRHSSLVQVGAVC